ncbi:recombinase family protein [Bengtsoniella intestinalis]|uniref:recombinase family protein n=1 Tax=Bengtsoniella intestinalis TaxID=3073143 RepID=UPI00391F13C4
MLQKTVTKIDAIKTNQDKLRVAAYCRVSSDSADQLNSYAAQIKAYTQIITSQADWELVDIYADEGITGTKLEGREEFQRMMSDCRKGRVDRLLVKSLSRFARNTKDCLSALRELATLGVTVKFEKENIDTGTLTTELMVSVSGALAQQESVSISQNQRLSYRRRMERGEFITCKAPFGYRLIGCSQMEIVPEQATLVQGMFEKYLDGISLEDIATWMSALGVATMDGNYRWQISTIQLILSNEKYVGDALCQKRYTTDFPFVKKRNGGEVAQYYIEDTHPAIIDRETFEKVQALIKRKGLRTSTAHTKTLLSLKVRCAHCGTLFKRRISKKGDTYWVCRTHDQKASDCPVKWTSEETIYQTFITLYNKLKSNYTDIFPPALRQLEELQTALQRNNPQLLEINTAIAQTAEQQHKIQKLQTAGLLDAEATLAKRTALQAQMTTLRHQRRRVIENEDIEERVDAIQQTIAILEQGPDRMEELDEPLFEELVEQITIDQHGNMTFHLYGGITLTEEVAP